MAITLEEWRETSGGYWHSVEAFINSIDAEYALSAERRYGNEKGHFRLVYDGQPNDESPPQGAKSE